jgi:hypothetical protein
MCSSFGPILSARVSVYVVSSLFGWFPIEHTIFLMQLLKDLLGFAALAQSVLPPC